MHVLHLPVVHAVHDLMPFQKFSLVNKDGTFPHFFTWVRTS